MFGPPSFQCLTVILHWFWLISSNSSNQMNLIQNRKTRTLTYRILRKATLRECSHGLTANAKAKSLLYNGTYSGGSRISQTEGANADFFPTNFMKMKDIGPGGVSLMSSESPTVFIHSRLESLRSDVNPFRGRFCSSLET